MGNEIKEVLEHMDRINNYLEKIREIKPFANIDARQSIAITKQTSVDSSAYIWADYENDKELIDYINQYFERKIEQLTEELKNLLNMEE